MALPLPAGLVPSEVAFLCEMELVTVVPRQRLDSIPLLGGATPVLRPPRRETLPLWLALLLKKQRRANIAPPPWLHPASLVEIIRLETKVDPAHFSEPPPPPVRADDRGNARRVDSSLSSSSSSAIPLSPPFLPSCTADASAGHLPFHWLEMAETLLAHAADDMPAPAGEVRGLLRDLVEARAAKARRATTDTKTLGAGVFADLRGVGAMELAESRGFVLGVVDGVRRLGAGAEATRHEEEEERARNGGYDEDSDDDMEL